MIRNKTKFILFNILLLLLSPIYAIKPDSRRKLTSLINLRYLGLRGQNKRLQRQINHLKRVARSASKKSLPGKQMLAGILGIGAVGKLMEYYYDKYQNTPDFYTAGYERDVRKLKAEVEAVKLNRELKELQK
jgi:hypothetical protein